MRGEDACFSNDRYYAVVLGEAEVKKHKKRYLPLHPFNTVTFNIGTKSVSVFILPPLTPLRLDTRDESCREKTFQSKDLAGTSSITAPPVTGQTDKDWKRLVYECNWEVCNWQR